MMTGFSVDTRNVALGGGPRRALERGGRRLACSALGLFLVVLSACGDDVPRRVVIPPRSSFRVAADSLSRHGVIRFPRAFRAYASLTERDRSIRAGTYEFRSNQGWTEILDDLAAGRGLVHTITIPEGFALSSIVSVVSRALDVPPESVEVAARDTALRRRLDVPTPTLEGYLFPDTYTFPPGATARDAVGTMVERFEKVWKPAWDSAARALAMSRNDVMALAAIIEKEARLPEERPVISAVYHNRLRIGMRLQADPTVQYALGRHVERVLYKDLTIDSKYNTYKYAGLPPGPIASPGAASIDAALHPANVPYLYFVAHPDGHHEFRTTLKEHAEAIRQVRGGNAARTKGQASSRTTGSGNRPTNAR